MKTLAKRIPTKTAGVFYKEIISENNKVVDKVFLIRYLDENNKERLKTIGKFSKGIREAYCKAKLNEVTTKVKQGQLPTTSVDGLKLDNKKERYKTKYK